jgi:hypothetical protein
MWSIALLLSAQQKEVSGKVIEATNGESSPGATILIEGTQRGVITDINGDFSLQATDSETLVVSYLGYKIERLPVRGQTNFIRR